MDKETLKRDAAAAIESHREDLIRIGRELYDMPETGFEEYRTAEYARHILESLGLPVESGIACTGLCAQASGRTHGHRVAVLGELDALVLPSHPHADPVTGAAHACGHFAQIVMMLGTAIGLISGNVMPHLNGDVVFMGVPAEESVKIEFRQQLREEGKLVFLCGKQEFIRLGMFDGVDAVISGHLSNTGSTGKFRHSMTHNGMISKSLCFHGVSAHAGMQPEAGINALQAAVNAINNINALRSSLPDADKSRIHFIITKGGDSVNIIPDDVRMELCVRAASLPAMEALDARVDRAVHAGAESVGAKADICNLGFYMPSHPDRTLNRIFAENASRVAGADNVIDACDIHRGSSTDVGDVASLLPYCYFNFGGASGAAHKTDFDVADENFAYVEPAKAAAMTVIDLLADGGSVLSRVRENYRPAFPDKEAYLAFCRRKLGFDN